MRSQFFQIPHVPPIIPTLAWYDPSDASTLTVASNLCSQMTDKSGNGRTLTAAGSARMSSGTATINGLNVLVGSAATGMASANVTVAQPITVLQVVKLTTLGANTHEPIGSSGANGFIQYYNGSNGFWAYYAGTVVNSAVSADTATHLLDSIFNGASSALFLDAAQIAVSNPGTQGFSASPIRLGNDDTLTTAGWIGSIGETLMYSSALSTTNRQQAEAYLKAKWATP